MINKIKDFINRHKIRIQVEYSWKEKKPTKIVLQPTEPVEYNINNIIWYQTIASNIMIPYYYNRDEKKPLEQYVEYSGLNSSGYVKVNDFLQTKN